MIQYKTPVRNNTPQTLQYTFYDQNNNIIPLSGFVSCTLVVKFQGAVYATVPADIQSPTSSGIVRYSPYVFSSVGVWDAQFFVTDSFGNNTWGDIIQFLVVPNVEDLSLNQLPVY